MILFAANFDDEYPLKNLYKALNVVRPDALLLQISPDIAFNNFKVDEVSAANEPYHNQIKVSGSKLFPSAEYREQIQDFLRSSGILV